MEKKLNNLLDFSDFEKSWKPEEPKKTKRTEVGLDVVKEEKKNEPGIEVDDLKKGIDKKLNNLLTFDDFESMAFEVTPEDVITVMKTRFGKDISYEEADKIHGMLDFDEIESAALWYDDLDEQTNGAYDEMENQIKNMGY